MGGLSKPVYAWDYLRTGSKETVQRLTRVNTWHALVESLPQFILQTYITALSTLTHAVAPMTLPNRLRLYASIAMSLRSLVSAMWRLRTGPPPYEFGHGSFVGWGVEAWWMTALMAAATLLETLHRVTLVVLFALVFRGWAVVAVAVDLGVKLLWFMDPPLAVGSLHEVASTKGETCCFQCSFLCVAACYFPIASAPAAATSLIVCVSPTRLEWLEHGRARIIGSDAVVWLLNACGSAALLATLAVVGPNATGYAAICGVGTSRAGGGGANCLPGWVFPTACAVWATTYAAVLPLLMVTGAIASKPQAVGPAPPPAAAAVAMAKQGAV